MDFYQPGLLGKSAMYRGSHLAQKWPGILILWGTHGNILEDGRPNACTISSDELRREESGKGTQAGNENITSGTSSLFRGCDGLDVDGFLQHPASAVRTVLLLATCNSLGPLTHGPLHLLCCLHSVLFSWELHLPCRGSHSLRFSFLLDYIICSRNPKNFPSSFCCCFTSSFHSY